MVRNGTRRSQKPEAQKSEVRIQKPEFRILTSAWAQKLQPHGTVPVQVRLLQSAGPLIGLLLGFRLGDAVSFLNPPDQLVFLAGDDFPVIVGELAPALLCPSPQLLPLPFHPIPLPARPPLSAGGRM